MIVAYWISLFVCALTAWVFLEIALGARRIGQLKAMPQQPHETAPKVSVILAALNEAAAIEPALLSLLRLDYPELEVIAVNDRSTDATPAILDRLASADPRLRVLHIAELPAGWLGKNHALHRGAQAASGRYLLFTDADVMFEPSSVSRAVAYCERDRVDHLTLLFEVVVKSPLLAMLVLSFSINFMARFKPWKVASSRKHYLGAGGSNLVRRDAYIATGGHAAIPLAVLDDLFLGKLLKRHGFSQRVLFGLDMVQVEWYRSASDMFKGLQKNAFAAFDYRLERLLAATIVMLLVRAWPWAALFFTSGFTWMLNATTVLFSLILYCGAISLNKWSYRCLLYAPIVVFLELFMWWHGSLGALQHQRIEWRGTVYSLDALRKGQDASR